LLKTYPPVAFGVLRDLSQIGRGEVRGKSILEIILSRKYSIFGRGEWNGALEEKD
jgi:hypothetical protein